ncbi:MAG TPA: lysylphosphatidylglycerol synthase domain-containing protein, partial [Kofleriaceae bacterium]
MSESAEQTPPKWLKWVTRISLVVGIGALIATVWIVGVDAILHHLRAIGWFFVVLVAIEMLSSTLDGTAIYFMAHGKGRPTWREAVVAQIVGRGVNSVTPGGNLGEALKVGLLSQRCSARRIVAAVMYVGLITVVMSFSVVAIGSAATAFLFDVPRIGMVALLVGSAVAAGIAVAIVVLLRRGMLSTLSNALARVRLISKKRRESWNKTLGEVDARLRGTDDGDYR